MTDLRFEWDEAKNWENIGKHGISFEDAEGVFADQNAVWLLDPDDSGDEERFLTIGYCLKARLLVVCNCHRENDTIIRIISARKADKREEEEYGRGNYEGPL